MIAYPIRPALFRPELRGLWDGPAWAQAETLEVACFRPEGTDHRPRTLARLLYDPAGIYGIFWVDDRYVRSVHRRYGDPVYRDSCVELFLEPRPGRGYLNFELNAGGTLLASHIVDPVRTPDGFRDFTPLPEADGRAVRVYHSLPEAVDPEIDEPTVWTLELFVPFSVLEKHAGAMVPRAGTEWRGNFYKCGDDTSHPHWASWSPLEERSFHLPRCFGPLLFR